jgi:hypothetical protein
MGEFCDEDDQERFFSVNPKALIPPEIKGTGDTRAKNIGQSCIIHTTTAKTIARQQQFHFTMSYLLISSTSSNFKLN